MADVNNPIANLSIEDLIQSAEGPKPTTYSPLISDEGLLGGIGSFYKTLSDSFNQTQDAKKGMGLGVLNLFKQAGSDIGDGAAQQPNINAGMSNVDLQSIDDQAMDYIPTDDFLGMPIDSNIIDSYTEQSVMGMAPPVGDPAAARKVQEAEAKKAIADEAALNRREKALGDTKIDSAPSSTEDLFSSAMQDVIASVRGTGPDTPEQKTIDDYKKEFSEATGIDVSGKVDKSAALMAMGLSLMQNKAGPNFNVGKMLSEVGRAGEAALPALTAAKKEAKVGAAQAGKYAIEMRSADESKRTVAKEKMMARENYYLIPKGEGISGQIANLDKGSLQSLNKYELSKLMENPEFSSKFDVLPGSSWANIVEEAMKTPEAKDLYLTTGRNVNLIPGNKDDIFQIRVFDPNPNNNPNGKTIFPGDGAESYRLLSRMAKDLGEAEEKFIDLGLLAADNRNVFTYTADKINSFGSALGIRFSDNETESGKMIRILDNIAMKNASKILGESGKTISDGDRERVERIVGELKLGTDIRSLRARIDSLFSDIIVGGRRDIQQGLSTLNKYTGRKIGDQAYNNASLDEKEQEVLNLYMKNFKKDRGS